MAFDFFSPNFHYNNIVQIIVLRTYPQHIGTVHDFFFSCRLLVNRPIAGRVTSAAPNVYFETIIVLKTIRI